VCQELDFYSNQIRREDGDLCEFDVISLSFNEKIIFSSCSCPLYFHLVSSRSEQLCCLVCFNFKEPTPARFRLLVISAGCSAGLSCRRQEVFTRTVFSSLTSCFRRCFSLEHCAFVQLCRPDLFLRVAVLGCVLWPGQLLPASVHPWFFDLSWWFFSSAGGTASVPRSAHGSQQCLSWEAQPAPRSTQAPDKFSPLVFTHPARAVRQSGRPPMPALSYFEA
jgi:hypothetical protein